MRSKQELIDHSGYFKRNGEDVFYSSGFAAGIFSKERVNAGREFYISFLSGRGRIWTYSNQSCGKSVVFGTPSSTISKNTSNEYNIASDVFTLYKKHGLDFPLKIPGVYSFLIYDEIKKELYVGTITLTKLLVPKVFLSINQLLKPNSCAASCPKATNISYC